MPEGDTIFRAARALQMALATQTITGFTTRLGQLADLDRQEPFVGRTIERVESVGKHILMRLSPDLILRTHMRMHGSWHLYRPGERWQQPAHEMRIVIETTPWSAVAFRVQVADIIRADPSAIARHRPLAVLGPDLLGDFDADEALRRVRAQSDRPVHVVLLDQRVMAGIGNVFKSEILFLSALHPDTPAAAVDDAAWRTLMALAQKLLRANVVDGPGARAPVAETRVTTGALDPSAPLWVYGRAGKPCRRCGTPIQIRKDGPDARLTYWCGECQTKGVRSVEG